MSRKVSVDSVTDASADDLLRFLYDLTLRQPSLWGWVVAGAFAAIPAWLAIVSMMEGNIVGAIIFVAMTATVPSVRYYFLRRKGYAIFGKLGIPANDG